MITLTVLGCSGSYPGPGGACSGYLVQGGGVRVWVDAGSGTLANLQRHIDVDTLDAVVVSHAHPDHWSDLLSYLVLLRYYRPRPGVALFGPAEVQRLAREFHGDLGPELVWTEIGHGHEATIGGLHFRFARTDHPGETFAMRIDDQDGAALGYSADTGPGWSLSELGPGLDLALCEAGLVAAAERTALHLTPKQAGVSARAAGAARLVLTHLPPGTDAEASRAEAVGAFGGPVEVAAVDACFEVACLKVSS